MNLKQTVIAFMVAAVATAATGRLGILRAQGGECGDENVSCEETVWDELDDGGGWWGGDGDGGAFPAPCTAFGTGAKCGTRTTTTTVTRCTEYRITEANGEITFSPTKPSGGGGFTFSCVASSTTTIVETIELRRETSRM